MNVILSFPQFRIFISQYQGVWLMKNSNYVLFHQQMQLPSVMPILVLGLAQYTSMLLAALAERLTLLTALKLVLVSTACVATQRMLEYDVKV